MWPFVSYRSEKGGETDVSDWTSLVGYKGLEGGGSSFHLINPFIFDYEKDKENDRCSWDSMFGSVSYEAEGDNSEFSLLYYLYRQKTAGTETERDIFPFITWDSGEKKSGFSFFWRLFDYERNGDKVGGHVLFIPWGET